MNRLHKDLNLLVNRVEAWELPRVSAGPWRQKFHLMPPCGWMNDTNGLCWHRGNYHVYYQYSPFNVNLELFLNDGEQVMTSRFYPQEPLYLRLEGEGYAELYDMNAMEMKTIQDERRP